MKIVIIDYGAGNTRSVEFAFNRIGVNTLLSDDPETIQTADGVIFPGVGHAQHAMNTLNSKGLDKLIPSLNQPVLGICLGMQLLCESSEEGNTRGLGIINSTVVKFDDKMKIPKIGWNNLKMNENELFTGVNQNEYFYFVHSYYVPQNDFSIGQSEYGIEYTAALNKDNFYGCQFHPEKSGVAGEQILKNFIKICK